MSWTLLWYALTAIGTLAMAGTTAWVIIQNRRHHREVLRPLCVLEPLYGMDDPMARGRLLHKRTVAVSPGNFLDINCSVKNVGKGPAVNVRLGIKFTDMNGLVIEKELGAIAADSRWNDSHPITVPVRVSANFNQTDFGMSEDKPWELWLWYESVFKEQFFTRHAKTPQEPWTVFGSMVNVRRKQD